MSTLSEPVPLCNVLHKECTHFVKGRNASFHVDSKLILNRLLHSNFRFCNIRNTRRIKFIVNYHFILYVHELVDQEREVEIPVFTSLETSIRPDRAVFCVVSIELEPAIESEPSSAEMTCDVYLPAPSGQYYHVAAFMDLENGKRIWVKDGCITTDNLGVDQQLAISEPIAREIYWTIDPDIESVCVQSHKLSVIMTDSRVVSQVAEPFNNLIILTCPPRKIFAVRKQDVEEFKALIRLLDPLAQIHASKRKIKMGEEPEASYQRRLQRSLQKYQHICGEVERRPITTFDVDPAQPLFTQLMQRSIDVDVFGEVRD